MSEDKQATTKPSLVNVELKTVHTHKRQELEAGAVISVRADQAERMEKNNIAVKTSKPVTHELN